MTQNASHIYTVNGVTATLMKHAATYGVAYKRAWQRLDRYHWSIEQALELKPAPQRAPRRAPGTNWRTADVLPRGQRLASLDEIFALVLSGSISGEEYLRLEGVPLNEHPLSERVVLQELSS